MCVCFPHYLSPNCFLILMLKCRRKIGSLSLPFCFYCKMKKNFNLLKFRLITKLKVICGEQKLIYIKQLP